MPNDQDHIIRFIRMAHGRNGARAYYGGDAMKFPRLTSADSFIQSNLDIGYLRADMEEVRKEWEHKTRHLRETKYAPFIVFTPPIRLSEQKP